MDQSTYQSLGISVNANESIQRQNYTQRAISQGPYVQHVQTPLLMNPINQNENQYVMQSMNKQVGYLTV